ncbi:hypothetical protein FQA23_0008797, partial [Aptenodytes patagonicus]
SYHSLKDFQRQLQQPESIHTETISQPCKNPGILPPGDSFQLRTLFLFNRTCGGSVIVKDFENRNSAKLLLLHAI